MNIKMPRGQEVIQEALEILQEPQVTIQSRFTSIYNADGQG